MIFFARINLWSYDLPGLMNRPEDIEPNLDYLLERAAQELGSAVRFNAEAKKKYLRFAESSDATWQGNFRDLAASVTRLATLATSGRIGRELVDAEIQRLQWLWQRANGSSPSTKKDASLDALLSEKLLAVMDLFERLQLESVIRTCRESRTLSDAGRKLFNVSRSERSVVNDADRLRKYLARSQLDWEQVIA